MAHRAPGASDAGAGPGRRPAEGRLTMRTGSMPKTEGRRGSQRRLQEGGRYLGIPGNDDFRTARTERIHPDDRRSVLTQCPRDRVRYILGLRRLVLVVALCPIA